MVSLDIGRESLAVPVSRKPFRLIWVDKLCLALAAAGLVMIGYLWIIAAVAAGIAGANNLARHEIGLGLAVDFAVAAVSWLLLMAVDFVAGGPRRRARRTLA